MTNKHKSNLAKTALTMLESDIKLSMGYFLENENYWFLGFKKEIYNQCGTTACFAGFGPLALDNEVQNWDWNQYIIDNFGLEDTEEMREWSFLFDEDWPNSKRGAAARALVFLQKGVPEEWRFNSRFLKNWSVDEIKEGLKKFV